MKSTLYERVLCVNRRIDLYRAPFALYLRRELNDLPRCGGGHSAP